MGYIFYAQISELSPCHIFHIDIIRMFIYVYIYLCMCVSVCTLYIKVCYHIFC